MCPKIFSKLAYSCALFLFFISSGFCRQQSLTPDNSSSTTSILKPGIVVEKLERGGEGEKAELKEGDIILAWACGDRGASIESPFDVPALETDEAPHGGVRLQGLRGEEKKTWTLGPGKWGIETRPNFTETVLTVYQQGLGLSNSSRPADAVKTWTELARRIQGDAPGWLGAWLLFRAAERMSDADDPVSANRLFDEAVQQAAGASPAVLRRIGNVWGNRCLARNDFHGAEQHFRLMLSASQKLGEENLGVASSFNQLGLVGLYQDDLSSADKYFQKSLAIREKLVPNTLTLAGTLDNLGVVATRSSQLPRAETYLLRSAAIREKLSPESQPLAGTLINLGSVYYYLGDFDKGEAASRHALSILHRLAPGNVGEARVLNNLGDLETDRGDLKQAEIYLQQALTIKKRLAPDSGDVGTTLINLARIYAKTGELNRAEDYYHQGLAIARKIAPTSLDVAEDLTYLGELALQRGDLESAETWLKGALDMGQKAAPDNLNVATSLIDLGNVELARAHGNLAEQFYLRALRIQETRAPHTPDIVLTLTSLADLASKRGKTEQAEQYLNRARAVFEGRTPRNLQFAMVLNGLGEAALTKLDLTAAEKYFRQALDIRADLIPGTTAHAETLNGLALTLREENRLSEADRTFAQALDALENQTAHLGGTTEIRYGFRGLHAKIYQQYIDLLMAERQSERAFQVLERSRARTVLETLAMVHADIRKGVDPKLLEQARSIQADIGAKADRRAKSLSGEHATAQVAQVEKELAELRSLESEVNSQIRSASPAYAALTQPIPLDARGVQKNLLDAQSVLLEYALGDARSYLFVVTRTSLRVYPLPSRARISRLARIVYRSITERSRRFPRENLAQRQERFARAEEKYDRAATELSTMILGPVLRSLNGMRLLIVSDGALQYLPFAALPAAIQDRTPIVATHEVINLPSATVVATLRQLESRRQPATKLVAVLADPVFGRRDTRVSGLGESPPSPPPPSASAPVESHMARSVRDVGLSSLPRLPFSREEAAVIVATAPPGQAEAFLDFDASRTIALGQDLAEYKIVHFATHGLLDSGHPEFSGLVLSLVDRQGSPQNGFVTLEDIYNLDWKADLVALSACETALGKAIQGEGLTGLTQGFMFAGAPRVMASLWSVDDAATASLMAGFYKGVLNEGLSPGEALRSTQVRMWKQKRWRNPYYWGGFVLQGEWKPLNPHDAADRH